MSNIIIRDVSFAYPGAEHPIFENLKLTISSHWHVALVGRNGRGKTTLLKLISGTLAPDLGSIDCHQRTSSFPATHSANATTLEAALDAAGPYRQLEVEMENCLASNAPDDLERYAELEQRYASIGGYEVRAKLEANLDQLDVTNRSKPLADQSGGEQTRALLAGLFAAPDNYPLIDEPTNHLDQAGRETVAEYLAHQSGFLLVCHDRAFLDRCTDHTIALNKDSVETVNATYSTWRSTFTDRMERQAADNSKLRREAQALRKAGLARREGAMARESEKAPHTDKGFTGARAARQMKRALAAEQRMNRAADARLDTLHDVEADYPLTLEVGECSGNVLNLHEFVITRQGQPLFEPLDLQLTANQRVRLSAGNGIGKSLLFAALAGDDLPSGFASGGIARSSPGTKLVHIHQHPVWQVGSLSERLATQDADPQRVRHVLAALGMRGEVLNTPLERMSAGQRKKVEIARCWLSEAHLWLWDEPLNYLDVETREKIEAALLAASPTMLFVEHDATFATKVASEVLELRAPSRRS